MSTNNKEILLFSAGRTGSTLIWQCLKEIFDNVVKIHPKEMRESFISSNADCVITQRDPIESYLSFVRCTVLKGDPNTFKEKINEKSYLLSGAINYKNDLEYVDKVKKEYSGRILALDYSEFNKSYNYIFSKFQNFFDIEIEESKRQSIIKKTSKSTNKNIQSQLKDFHDSDPDSCIHGFHILSDSDTYYSNMITDDNMKTLKQIFYP